MFEYVPRRVGGETGRFVEWVWFARGRITGVRERIAPTGLAIAAVVLGDPIQQTPVGEGTALSPTQGSSSVRTIGRSSTSRWATRLRRIVTTPVGCRPVLGLAPAPLRVGSWPCWRIAEAAALGTT